MLYVGAQLDDEFQEIYDRNTELNLAQEAPRYGE